MFVFAELGVECSGVISQEVGLFILLCAMLFPDVFLLVYNFLNPFFSKLTL